MRYLLTNLKLLFTRHILICVLFLLCQTVSVFGLVFSVGVTENYRISKNTMVTHMRTIYFRAPDASWTAGRLKELVNMVTPQEHTILVYIACYLVERTGNENVSVMAGYIPELERVSYSQWTWDQKRDVGFKLSSGRLWTHQEYFEGVKYAIVLSRDGEVGGVVDILGEPYEIIGVIGNGVTGPQVPLYSLPDDAPITSVGFGFDPLPTRAQYETIRDKVIAVFGDPAEGSMDFELYEADELRFISTVIVSALATALLTAVNLAILFRYVLGERRKALSILRLHGCTPRRARWLYIGEVMAVSVPLYALCVCLYHTLLLPRLETIYPYIGTVYSLKSTLVMAAVYLCAVFLILYSMVAVHVRKTPARLLREGVH